MACLMCLRERPRSLAEGPMGLNTLVAMTACSRGMASLRRALPRTTSLAPFEYMSAVSKKLMPASQARWMKGRLSGSSRTQGRHFEVPYVMQPRQRRETLTPARPRLVSSMLCLSSITCACLLFAGAAIAQPQAERTFDAASVKPAITSTIDQRLQIDASHFSVRAIPYLIRQAFDVNPYQVSGDPAWMGKNLWAINASIVGPANHAQMMGMLRNLLVERFHLKTHFETRQTKV